MPVKIGRYEVQSELGRGGMAVVYKAYDPRFERMVAIKVLPREFMHDPQFIGRFNREAKTIAALDHPAIVPVFDYGDEEGQPFLVMRYMPGGSLADRLENGPLPLEQATIIIQRLSSALNRAHSQGIVHRDLKPNNVLFDQYEDAYLADFGIAHISSSAGASPLTTSGSMLGTPSYMSPEQIHGESTLDGRSDIYALGVIFFQLLTGRVPYIADTATKILMKHIMDPVPDLRQIRPDLPQECQDVITKAMAKKPEQRFGSADEMASAVTVVNQRVRFAEYSSGVESSVSTGVMPSSMTSGQIARPQTPPPFPSTGTGGSGVRPQTPPPPKQVTPPPEVLPSAIGSSGVMSTPETSGRSLWVWLALGAIVLVCLGGIALAAIYGLGEIIASSTATPTATQAVVEAPSVTVDAEGTRIAQVTETVLAQQNAEATAHAGTATALFRPTITPRGTATPPPSHTPNTTPDAAATPTQVLDTPAPTTPINLPPIFGPENGQLPHELDDFIETYYIDANSRDFVMQATFGVPFTALDGIWDVGFIFRQVEGDDAMRLVMRSSGYWSLNNRVGTSDNFVVEGDVSNLLNLRANQTNTLTLVAQGDRGYFLLNNNFISVLDLTGNQNEGDVALGTGFYTEDEIEGAITTYSDLYIWSQIPDFGPVDGELEHVDDGFIESYNADVLLTNFIADAVFTNPYAVTEEINWDAGFSFRHLENGDQYWVVADSTLYWALIDRVDEEDVFLIEGDTDLLNLDAGGENRLTLIAWNDIGYFLINDQLVDSLDLSGRVAAGDLAVITAFFIENELPGSITNFTGFTVWALP